MKDIILTMTKWEDLQNVSKMDSGTEHNRSALDTIHHLLEKVNIIQSFNKLININYYEFKCFDILNL